MTLQEAINHALEKAEQLGDCECAKEHLQLAQWLQELKDLKEETENLTDNVHNTPEPLTE